MANVTLTLAVSPSGAGSLQLKPIGSYVAPLQYSYPAGTKVTVIATNQYGYNFDGFWGFGLEDNLGYEYIYGGRAVDITLNASGTLTAKWVLDEPTTKVILDTVWVGQGSVVPKYGEYAAGTEVVVVATPATGWVFERWSGDLQDTYQVPNMPNNLKVMMNSDHHIAASFINGTPEEPPDDETVLLDKESRTISIETVDVKLLDSASHIVDLTNVEVILMDSKTYSISLTPEDEEPPPDGEFPDSENNWMIWAIVGSVVVVALTAAIILSRRK